MKQIDLESLTWLGRCRLALRRLRKGKIGDFSILKASAFGATTSTELANKLADVRGYQPEINLDSLARLPNNTFGNQYAHWMRQNQLTPFIISPDLTELVNQNTYFVRYAITHDMFHVLTGFDITYAGEIGVLAFAVAQCPTKEQRIALTLATLWYPIIRPHQIKLILSAKQKGNAMGKRATLLIEQRLEEYFEEDLNHLRNSLNLS